ncbi:MAG: hypothetical protein PHW59_04915 [Desulfobacterales bacterium]|nr:hypothetical protein [Desulfobacterales bacterium]
MAMPNEPINELVREMYARFGLAYYHSEVLHRGLCIILAMSDLPRRDFVTRPRVEERLAHAFSLTLGGVIKALAGKLPEEFSVRLDEVCERRNFLAHHFWFDRAHLMFRADHVEGLIAELDRYTRMFSKMDEDTSAWFDDRRTEIGLTDDDLQQSLARVLSGQNEPPLPGKNAVRQVEKKLRGKQRLVHVWEFQLPEGGKPLVFEMADGTLWQLCDVGLGWTRFQKTEPHWVEHPVIKPYLPADIAPRPGGAKPWEYEFRLKRGAVFWVQPGQQPQTFRWGIRTKTGGIEQQHAADQQTVK